MSIITQINFEKVSKVVFNMKISLIIPTFTLNKELAELTIRCALSYKEHVDEIIIEEDGGLLNLDLMQVADRYHYNKENVGFTKNVNRGLRSAEGDYIMVVNSDTELMSGKLEDLCVPNKVTSPIIANQYIDRLAGPFFVIPRNILNERGYLLEELKTYSSDSEFDNRVADIFQKIETVKIFHHQAKTVKAAGIEGGKGQQRDREIYQRLKEEGKAK